MEMLTNSGYLGIPDEYFCPQNRARFIRKHNLPESLEDRKLVQAIIENHTSKKGIFSAKLFPDNLDWIVSAFAKGCGSADGEFLKEIFPNPVFVCIDRTDKLGQAVSLVKSQQTSLWHSDSQPLFKHLKPYYDRGKIHRAKEILESDSQRWKNFFNLYGIEPLYLNYEEFSPDLTGTVKKIFDHVDVEFDSSQIGLPSKHILRDSTSEEWKKRYETESDIIEKIESVDFLDREQPSVEIQADLGEIMAANFPVRIDFTLKNLLSSDLYCLGDRAWRGRMFLVLEMVSPSTDEKVQEISTLPAKWGSEEKLNISMMLNSPRKEGVYSVFVKVLQRNNGFLESAEPFHQSVNVIDPIQSLYEEFFGDYQERPDQWVYTPGFGYSYWKRFPWVLHGFHGWMKITGKTANRLVVWDDALEEWEIQCQDGELRYFSKRLGEFRVKSNSLDQRTLYPLASEQAIRLPQGVLTGSVGLFGESPKAFP